MSTSKQAIAVTLLSIRGIPQRLGASLVAIVGCAGVVAVLVAVMSMSAGMSRTLRASGSDARVVVLRNGSASETSSALGRDAVRAILDAPGIRRVDSQPIASAEVLRFVKVTKRGGGEATMQLRGIGPQALRLRPEMRLVAGRFFTASRHEAIVGRAALERYPSLGLGSRVATRTATWTIVGVFESSGDSHESELLADADAVLASDHGLSYGNVTVQLETPQSFTAFVDALTTQPALRIDVVRERDYYARQSQTVNRLLNLLIYGVGAIMGLGAVFAALNTMYSAVGTRAREFATLRALGFGATPIVVSVLIESLLLAASGGVLGGGLAWLCFDGLAASTTQGSANTQLAFALAVTPGLIATGIALAAGIGVLGGVLPAARAARLPIVAALRAR